MKIRVNLKICFICFIVTTLIFTGTGCTLLSKKETRENNVNPPKQTNENKQESSQQIEDKDIVEKIKKEKGVKNASVYTQNNVAFAVIITDKSMSKDAVNKLANKYAKELKEKYKNQKITVQASLNEKDWININLD